MPAPITAPPTRPANARFVRLAETDRPAISLIVDGVPCAALQGDTLLVALMCNGRRVRDSEFGDGPRAGFCLMGACQDCWAWTPAGERLRTCSTPALDGMAVLTRPPQGHWPMTQDLRESLAKQHLREPPAIGAGLAATATSAADVPAAAAGAPSGHLAGTAGAHPVGMGTAGAPWSSATGITPTAGTADTADTAGTAGSA